jgi:YjbE family integral membrane protein
MQPLTFLFLDILSIILIDVVLAGDNAVVIAMAVRSLPERERKFGIAAGAAGAVIIRVILTFFAAKLLEVPYIKLVGGAVILWIAVKLLLESVEDETTGKHVRGIWHAVWLIMLADVTMSTDNVLAVAAASKGDLELLILGLGLSITLVVFASNLLAGLMAKYPAIVWIGAAILARVGGDMMMSDSLIEHYLAPSATVAIGTQVACVVGVLLAGLLARRAKHA